MTFETKASEKLDSLVNQGDDFLCKDGQTVYFLYFLKVNEIWDLIIYLPWRFFHSIVIYCFSKSHVKKQTKTNCFDKLYT